MRRKETKKVLVILAGAVLLALGLAIPTWAAEFSADMLQKMAGQTQTGKIFMKGSKMRMEMDTPGGKTINIILPDEGKSIMLIPQQKMYMEMSSADTPGSPPPAGKDDLEKMADLKNLGKEKINGYSCDKYEVIYNDKTMGKMIQWISPKLNIPLKMAGEGPHGDFTLEYKNIKEGGVPDSMFQVPPGYQKMQMPSMPNMPGMGKGMPKGMGY